MERPGATSDDDEPEIGVEAGDPQAPPRAPEGLQARLLDRFQRYQQVPVVGVAVDLLRRDSESAGSMIGSAVAFRLFLFFVPLLLFVVGLAGFVSGHVDPDQIVRGSGISGGLGAQIRNAFHQSGNGPWVVTFLGLFGMVTAGRSLSRVLVAAANTAWRLSMTQKAPWRIVGSIAGLGGGIVLIAILVNRARNDLGVGVAGLSLGAAFAVYTVAWMFISLLLPRGTEDPGALLPGAAVFGAVLTVMEAVSQFYLPDQFTRASELYGAIGATVVTLGWFFILGRAIVIAIEINPVIYQRYGSVSGFVFSLPVLRALPRRSGRLRRFFDLDPPA